MVQYDNFPIVFKILNAAQKFKKSLPGRWPSRTASQGCLIMIEEKTLCCKPGWQKLCEGTKGLRRKVWTQTKKFSTNIRYFVTILRFVAIYTILGYQSVFFWSKTVFLGKGKHYYMVYNAYYTELNWQICNSGQKRRICRKNSKYAPEENFCGHFCPRRKLPTSATLSLTWNEL